MHLQDSVLSRPVKDALRPGVMATGKSEWERWMTPLGQSVMQEKLLSGGRRETQRSPARGCAAGHGADGNCVAKVRVRSGVLTLRSMMILRRRCPEFSSYAVGVGKRPEGCIRSNRNIDEGRSAPLVSLGIRVPVCRPWPS